MIINAKFSIPEENYKATLIALVEKYSNIKSNALFKNKQTVSAQLQVAFYLIGLHVKVNPASKQIFAISTVKNPHIPCDVNETFKIIAPYVKPECYVEMQSGEEVITISFDELKNPAKVEEVITEEPEAPKEVHKEVPKPTNIKKPGRPGRK